MFRSVHDAHRMQRAACEIQAPVQGEDRGCWKYDHCSVTSEAGGPFGSTQYTFDHVFGALALHASALASVAALRSPASCASATAQSASANILGCASHGWHKVTTAQKHWIGPFSARAETRTQEVYEKMLCGIVTSVISGFNGTCRASQPGFVST
jgi:hypothetical protein